MESEIIELLLAKDEYGLELLAKEHEKLIRYIAGTILGSREATIDECVNDVYLKVWKNADRYDYKKASLKTYIKAITRNTALNHLRKQSRIEEVEGAEESDSLRSEYIDYRQDVEQNMIFSEDVKAFNRVLASFRKKDRELIIRRYFYLQSTEQIAKALNMSENAIYSKLSRLRKELKNRYDKEVAL